MCKSCGDGVPLRSFCAAVYHNSEACLGEAQVFDVTFADSATFPWVWPACFKKGVAAVHRGRCSSQRVSVRPVPRSRARSAQGSEQFDGLGHLLWLHSLMLLRLATPSTALAWLVALELVRHICWM